MINIKVPKGNAIVLNRNNDRENTQQAIATEDYTHIFTSLEIILSKKFKKNILDLNIFTDRFCLFAVDKIYLVEKWSKQFRSLYAEIEKVQKKIPVYILLMGVLATITPKI